VEFIEKGIPLWKITIWDKRFNNVDNEWQPKTIKYNYLLSDELNSIKYEDGDVRILYTGKEVGYTTEELAGQNLSEGEIVSIPWGGIPSVKYHKGKFVTGDNRIATSSDVTRLTNKYLYYFLRGNINEVASYYRGASLKHPNMKDILKMKISFPSIDVQEEICTQLDILESIIFLRQKELLELDRLIKARFVEMFGDPEINPYGYKKAHMGDYITLLTDFSSNGSYETLDNGVTMYDKPNHAWIVRTTDLETGDMTSIKYIDESAYELLEKSKLFGGEIIMNKIGSAGNVYLMPEINMPASLGRNAFMFRYDDRINPKYLFQLLKSEYGQREIKQYVRGAVTKTITKNDVRAVTIVVPPIEIQNKYVDFIIQVNKSKVVSRLAASNPYIQNPNFAVKWP
jgi:restriction modification system DNA specificity domain protein